MNLIEIIKRAQAAQLKDEDGNLVEISLLPGMTPAEIDDVHEDRIVRVWRTNPGLLTAVKKRCGDLPVFAYQKKKGFLNRLLGR